jgi:hypothetical protein
MEISQRGFVVLFLFLFFYFVYLSFHFVAFSLADLKFSQTCAESLIAQSFISSTPSTLLLNYLKYGITTNLFDHHAFFETLSHYVDPKKPTHFEGILDLFQFSLPQLLRNSTGKKDKFLLRELSQVLVWLMEGVLVFFEHSKPQFPQSASWKDFANLQLDPLLCSNMKTSFKLLKKLLTKSWSTPFVQEARKENQGDKPHKNRKK